MLRYIRVSFILSLIFAIGFSACDLPDFNAPGKGPPPNPLAGAGIGGSCSASADCRQGLRCSTTTKKCEPRADRISGAMCFLSSECLPGLYCKVGTCAQREKALVGESCSSEGDCGDGLVCVQAGFTGTCAPAGGGDVGAACTSVAECRGGLFCSAAKCTPFAKLEPWPGAMCPIVDDVAPHVLFQVPRSSSPPEDFFRLPFPNDIRVKNGRVSMKGFPTPGVRLLPFDPVKRYLDFIEAESSGFGTNQAIFFRFSRDPDFESLKGEDVVQIVNITPGSPEYQYPKLAHAWSGTTGRGNYICPRSLVLRAPFGSPLRGGETYAAIIRTSARDKSGTRFEPEADFKAMLVATPPTGDAELAAAWKAYEPFRKWIADKKVKADELAVAAVFTTEKVEEVLGRVRVAVRAAPAPVVTGFAKCGPGVTSVCEDGKMGKEHERGCFEVDDRFDEYQGTVSIPVFQKGTAPYDEPKDGGGIEIVDGLAKVQRTEEVCFALSVPKGTAPGSGWPVVVYGHGTGGSYRSHIGQGLAAEYAAGTVAGGAAVPMAMLGYDGVLHGRRKGVSTRPSTELVYNFLNPAAARDNNLQAAADLLAIARALEKFNVGAVKLDPKKVGLWGHSQGANAAAVAAGYEPGYGATVLTGAGGTLLLSLLGKTQPVNIAAGVQFALNEVTPVDSNHPVLNLLQMMVERADPVNFTRRIMFEPPMGVAPHSVLQVYGTADSYAPVLSQRTVAQAGGLPLVGPLANPKDDFGLEKTMENPAKGNRSALPMGVKITAGQTQYNPEGTKDGHFVSTDIPAARQSVQRFLGSSFRDDLPTIAP